MLRRIASVGLAALAGLQFASAEGRTKTLAPGGLPGFKIWEQGSRALARSATLGNVRRTFGVRFKNETRSEIAEIDVRLRVQQLGATTYLSPAFPLRTFDNTSVPHKGSLLPFNKSSGAENFTVDYPGRFWTVGSIDSVEVVAIKAYDGPQDLRDIGHLFTWMVNTKDDEIVRRFAKEPRLVKTSDPMRMNPTLVSFAASGTSVQKYLLAHGGDLRSQTLGGSTVAHLAAFNTNPGVFDLLLSKNIPTDQPSKSGRSPLIKAIETGNPLAFNWLLAHGANPNRVDKDDRGAVYYALCEGQTHAFEALVRAGANPGFHNRNGMGWMHTAAMHNYFLLPYVFRAGVSANDVDPRFGITPLMAVARIGEQGAIPWLIQHGAKVDAKDRRGKTAFDYARESNTLGTDRFFRQAVAAAKAHP